MINLQEYLVSKENYIKGIARRYELQAQDRDDLYQDVSLKLIENMEQFRGESALDTYVHRIAVNNILMGFRKSGRNQCSTAGLASEGPSTEELYSARESMSHLELSAKLELNEMDYDTLSIEMDFIRGGDYAHSREFAGRLNLGEASSKSRRHRMRQSLRNILRKKDFF